MSKHISKFLSYILRHDPDKVGIRLDSNGWTDISVLISQCKIHGYEFSEEELFEIVRTNDKQRFALNENKTEIRANQGHSVEVDLNLKAIRPPNILYHGTSQSVLDKIKKEGLKKMSRHHVHLSKDIDTANIVANRRQGEVIILEVLASQMYIDGFKFYQSDNGVWLTDSVPIEYIKNIRKE